MITPPRTPAMPGECHPAYADRADSIRLAPRILDVVRLPEYHDAAGALVTSALDPAGPLDWTVRERVLVRFSAVGSLDPRFGVYRWAVWVDELGRQVADDPDRTEWVPRPWADPHRMLAGGEWNPWAVDRDVLSADCSCLVDDGRPCRIHPRPAYARCEICDDTGTDYLGRPCRIHGGENR